MTLSLTWKVSSCVFLFLLVSFFPSHYYYYFFLFCRFPFQFCFVPAFSFPFFFGFFWFLFPNSLYSRSVCPSHPFSVPSVCLNCASSFTVSNTQPGLCETRVAAEQSPASSVGHCPSFWVSFAVPEEKPWVSRLPFLLVVKDISFLELG